MELVKKKIAELKPLEKNVRKHSDKQIAELIRSLEQFGQTRAFVLDEDSNILVGNGMYFAMQRMGAEEGDCYVVKGLTEVQKKKLVLSDNKVFSLGFDDYGMIENYINEIVMTGDLDIAGFDEMSLQILSFEDRSEEVKTEAVSYGVNDKSTGEIPEVVPVSRPVDHNGSIPSPVEVSSPTPTTEVRVPVEETRTPEVVRRKVICPNCGEVIYLD